MLPCSLSSKEILQGDSREIQNREYSLRYCIGYIKEERKKEQTRDFMDPYSTCNPHVNDTGTLYFDSRLSQFSMTKKRGNSCTTVDVI